MRSLDVVTGWSKGLEPEQPWRVREVALAFLLRVGVLKGRGAARVEARS